MGESVGGKVGPAAKWSVVTELAAKLVTPVTTMVLARLLTPEAFGVLVTATMVISFAEIFTDAGFQKYIIQKEFQSNSVFEKTVNVAFWSNFILSVALWVLICLLSDPLARLVGNEGYGLVISISCICLPIGAISSIQMALYKRSMDFKTLFIVRMVGVFVPLAVTIPLAYFSHSYWSLIIGMIAQNLTNAFILTIKSTWKPRLYYNWGIFRNMFSFSFWSMIEAVSIWLTSYVDVFLVGTFLSTYYMGLYRTSITTVSSVMAVITASTTPVLFSALSRLQGDEKEFKNLFFNFQDIVAVIVMPLGIVLYFFSDTITYLILGEGWLEASLFIGWWGITSALVIVTVNYCGEVYRAKGKPKVSVIVQWLHIVFVIPIVFIALKYGYEILCISRSLARLESIVVNIIALYLLVKISVVQMINNLKAPIVASLIMVCIICLIPSFDGIIYNVMAMGLAFTVYFAVILSFRRERNMLLKLCKIKTDKNN